MDKYYLKVELTMYNKPQDDQMKIEQADLDTFKTITLIFALSTIGSIIFNFINNLLGSLVGIGGTAVLAVGILMLSRKYSHLASGMRVGLLFCAVIALRILTALFTFIYATPVVTSQNTQQQIQALVDRFHATFMFTAIIGILAGAITLLTAYYFTEWFNTNFANQNQTKTFLYYGVFYLIGEILAVYGEYLLFNGMANLDYSNGQVTTQDLSSLLPALLVIGIGGILVLIAAIFLIVAGFKIYNRVSDKAAGITPHDRFSTPGQMTYKPLQKSYGSNSFQSSSDQNINQKVSSKGLNSNNTSVNAYCRNCGAVLEPTVKFCQNCGSKV